MRRSRSCRRPGADGPGLALEEIRELLDVREDGVCASARSRMLSLVAGRIAETDRRIAELRAYSAHPRRAVGPRADGGVRPGLRLYHDRRPVARPWGMFGAAAVAACAVCCAGPLLAVLGGIGVTSAIGALWMPVLAVLAVAAGPGVVVVRYRRRTASCRTAPAAVDLGMPAVAHRRKRTGPQSDREAAGRAGRTVSKDAGEWPHAEAAR
ncbi:MerR family DNA-binding protein [Streptomyces sp. NPDC005463]|uniref:MerR family DNA-binding protein n=1 Tax=Streptomyces sp. NPDC005463 TaxID=3154465 RepID=UPI0033B29321